jgi:hypothetical protein
MVTPSLLPKKSFKWVPFDHHYLEKDLICCPREILFSLLRRKGGKTLNCVIEVVGLCGSQCFFFPGDISLFFDKEIGKFLIFFFSFSSVNLTYFLIFWLKFSRILISKNEKIITCAS